MGFTFTPHSIPDVLLIEPQTFKDNRGTFIEAYKQSDFLAAGIDDNFVQDNLSVSQRGVLRGLHYQNPPYAQAKLVRCVQGAIWDVVVDIRHGSPTYGHWVGAELTADNFAMLYVPVGFAHGFLALTDNATVHYKTSGLYHQPSDAGILWSDPAVNINWPLASVLSATQLRLPDLIISDKDQQLPLLANAKNSFTYSAPALV
jgi:dTDP-4-dehydrorhamnose 3,5-epimerase